MTSRIRLLNRDCVELVKESGSVLERRCRGKPYAMHDGEWFCAIHHPDAVAKRAAVEKRFREFRSRVVRARQALTAARNIAADALIEYATARRGRIVIENHALVVGIRKRYIAALNEEFRASRAMDAARVPEDWGTLNAWHWNAVSGNLARTAARRISSKAGNGRTTADTE